MLPAPLLPFLPSRLREGPALSHPDLPSPPQPPAPDSPGCSTKSPHPHKGKLRLEMGERSNPDKSTLVTNVGLGIKTPQKPFKKKVKENNCRSTDQLSDPFLQKCWSRPLGLCKWFSDVHQSRGSAPSHTGSHYLGTSHSPVLRG